MKLGTFESMVPCPLVGALGGHVGKNPTIDGSTGQTPP